MAASLFAAAAGCASDGGTSGSGSGTRAEGCATGGEACGDGFVCLRSGDESACAATCTGSADACGASASCAGVGVASIDVCQEPAAAEPEANEEPAEPPRVTCSTDADCEALAPGSVCGEWMGERDCTIPCAGESQCDLPSIGGIDADFLTCAEDQGSPGRDVCLPDPRCASNPSACVQVSLPGVPDVGGTDGTPTTGEPPPTTNDSCVEDDQCPGAYACTFEGGCATSCTDSFDCKFEASCSGTACAFD